MARLLRNRRSQPPSTSDEAAPNGTAPNRPGVNGARVNGTGRNGTGPQDASGWSRWPRTEPGFAETGPAPAPAMRVTGPVPAEEHPTPDDGDAADAPFWANWERVDEPGDLDDYGDGMPADGPADDAVTDVDPRPAATPAPVVSDPRGRPSANGRPAGSAGGWTSAAGPARAGSARAGSAGAGSAGAGSAGGAGDARPEGIGEHLGSIAHLSHNPRMRTWQRRVIIAVVVGLIAGIGLKDWRWGVTLAVLAAIADTIIRSRTSFSGPAGVRLTKAQ